VSRREDVDTVLVPAGAVERLVEKWIAGEVPCSEDIGGLAEHLPWWRFDDAMKRGLRAIGRSGDPEAFELLRRNYARYLRGPEWRARRRERLSFAGNRCELCNVEAELHVHHRTYERIGREELSDLITLCEGCHGNFHATGAPA